MIQPKRHLLSLSAQIVAAHVSNHASQSDNLPEVIRSVFNTLLKLNGAGLDGTQLIGQKALAREAGHYDSHCTDNAIDALEGYVHPTHGKTVFDDHLICMEDGLSMKMLKRHLLTVHGLTPDQYREKWGLPDSYPMVASEYAKLRSNLALQSGLGLKPEKRTSRGRKVTGP